jgi:general secretion pathway protein E
VYAAVGCPQCKWTGYRGRTGIYELLVVDEDMRRLVHDGAAESAIRAHGQARGMTMLRDDGLRWVAAERYDGRGDPPRHAPPKSSEG